MKCGKCRIVFSNNTEISVQYLIILYFQEILTGLSQRGHKVVKLDAFQSVVVGVEAQEDGTILANNDFRKSGAVDGF